MQDVLAWIYRTTTWTPSDVLTSWSKPPIHESSFRILQHCLNRALGSYKHPGSWCLISWLRTDSWRSSAVWSSSLSSRWRWLSRGSDGCIWSSSPRSTFSCASISIRDFCLPPVLSFYSRRVLLGLANKRTAGSTILRTIAPCQRLTGTFSSTLRTELWAKTGLCTRKTDWNSSTTRFCISCKASQALLSSISRMSQLGLICKTYCWFWKHRNSLSILGWSLVESGSSNHKFGEGFAFWWKCIRSLSFQRRGIATHRKRGECTTAKVPYCLWLPSPSLAPLIRTTYSFQC